MCSRYRLSVCRLEVEEGRGWDREVGIGRGEDDWGLGVLGGWDSWSADFGGFGVSWGGDFFVVWGCQGC